MTDPLSDKGVVAPWPGGQMKIDGVDLYVRRCAVEQAPGSPAQQAVMVHGLGGQSTNWTDLMSLLSDRLDSWAPDLPGFGWSPPPTDRDYGLTAGANAVAALIRQRGQRVHLFGNSLGGAICVRVAAEHPELVRSLILTSPALPDLRPRRHTMGVPAVAVPGLGVQVYRRLSSVPVERQVHAMLQLNYGNPSVVPEIRRQETMAEYARRAALPHAAEALSRTARGLLRAFVETGPKALWRQAASLTVPTLILYGGRDRLVDARRARRAARTIPHARVVVLPHVGHVPQMEAPQLVARQVTAFLDALAPG